MRRRDYLALLGASTASLAGCRGIGDFGDSGDGGGAAGDLTPAPVPAMPTENPRSNPPGSEAEPAPFPDVAPVADLAPLGRRLGAGTLGHVFDAGRDDDQPAVALQAGVVRDASPGRPALIRGRVVNRTIDDVSVPLARLPLVAGDLVATHAGSADASVAFVPTAGDGLASHAPTVTRTDRGAWRVTDGTLSDVYPSRLTLARDEVVPIALRVCPRFDGETLPIGGYAFVEREGGDAVDGGPGLVRPRSESSNRLSVWNAERPGPSERSSHAGAAPPPLPIEDSVQWYHDAGPETTAWLSVTPETVTPPANVTATLVNHSRRPIARSYTPRFWKLVDGQWFALDPRVAHLDTISLTDDSGMLAAEIATRPGERERIDHCLFRADSTACSGNRLPLGPLGGGRYALVRGVRRRFAALLDVDGPALSPTARSSITVVERSGDTVVLRREWERNSILQDVQTTVERVSSASREVILEQLYATGNEFVVDALAHFEPGVERVVIRQAAIFHGSRELFENDRFRYDGDAYAVSTSENA